MVTKTKVADHPTQQDVTETAAPVQPIAPQGDSNTLTVTSSCLRRIETLRSQKQVSNENSYYLRVFVDAGGCSGFTYKFELDDGDLEEDDIVIASDPNNMEEPRVVVDQSSLELIRGSTIDYVQEMIKSSFVVAANPQSESACGCGSSFAVKNFTSNPAVD
jgi:iron-sulfur cluster assembly accessory protein